jgi:two-component system nitrogen regulation response regulator NtrX
MACLLVVDDEPNIRRMLAALLEEEGHVVAAAGTVAEAVAALPGVAPDVVLLDLMLPDGSGMDVLERMRRQDPTVPVVMMSGRATLSDAVRATRLGAFHFIEKPLSPEAVLLTVDGAVELRRARELSRKLATDLGRDERLVGSSAAMQEVRALIARIAPSEARVLILGESGTGKELVATALHAGSTRAGGPFVRVNSAAMPRDLLESELFGHERGAFTGATAMRRGRFELAHGGTLFLDEVADLAPEAQAKLLRTIETGRVERVGGQTGITVDVRVLAATHRDLHAEVGAGRFREDLLYRLDVLTIRLPPLRDRLEDLPELVEHLFARLHSRHGLSPPALEPSALRRLRAHAWTGNVRELANLCERLCILHGGRSVDAGTIDALLGPRAARAPAGAGLSELLDAYERGLIERALAGADGRVADAARALRTDRANLYRRMRRLGIENR